MAKEGHDDYVVGYGRPPAHTRFQKGQSGNPKGRQKGCKNLSTLMERVLDETVTIKENGSQKIITKREAFLKQLVNKAASGDLRSIQLAINYLQQLELRAQPSTPDGEQPDMEDAALIDGILERLKNSSNKAVEEEEKDENKEKVGPESEGA
jgi:Family of unknown function (DUF5681)